jgi:hypothetical protein
MVLPYVTRPLADCSKRPSNKAAASEEAMPYSPLYGEPLSAARTKLEDFFNSLLALVLRSVHVNKRMHISRLGTENFVQHFTISGGFIA